MSDKIIQKLLELKTDFEKEKYINQESFNKLFSFMVKLEEDNDNLEKQLSYALKTGGEYLETNMIHRCELNFR